MPNLKSKASRIVRFLQIGIWRLDKSELPGIKAFLLKPLRILLLAVQGYLRDNCALRASALTFYSLLSIVPVIAMAFGIAKGFGLEQRLETQLYLRLAGQEEVLENVISFARSLLENTKGGIIAGIGVLVLFWTAVKLLGHIESALNQIWKVKSRSFIRRFTDYLAIMLLSPLLVIVSSSVTVYITTQVTAITGKLALLRVASPLIFFLLRLLPFALIWLLFILIYMVMPNTRVRFTSALIAGIIGGTVFQLAQGFYISAQVLMAKYNAIYGSFAALPLFLIWLQLSWMIVLFGAQIGYAHQHVGHYAMAVDYQNVSPQAQKTHALQILRLIVSRFESAQSPPSADFIAETLALPSSLIKELLQQLVDCAMVATVTSAQQEGLLYQPARDIHVMTMADVLEAWDRVGQQTISDNSAPQLIRISKALEKLLDERRQSKNNPLVKDL